MHWEGGKVFLQVFDQASQDLAKHLATLPMHAPSGCAVEV